jgi:protein-S-isoprenylcysteine O-methyltransferase Ste14
MSLLPEFELGLWNAWIITVLGSILPNITSYLLPRANKELMRRRMRDLKWGKLGKGVKLVLLVTQAVILPFTVVYSFFLPLQLGTVWFYAGLLISILGIVMPFAAQVPFATEPLDRPLTTGVYRMTRNPEYLSGVLQYLGIGVSCLSWVFLLCAAAWLVLLHVAVVGYEEPSLINTYGDAYMKYMKTTPRWIGIPRSAKKD